MRRPIDSVYLDQVELGNLAALRDREAVLALDRRIAEDAAFGRMEPGQQRGSRMAKVDTEVALRDDDLAITNRCPTITTNNNHGVPAWAFVVSFLAAVALIVALIAGVWIFLSHGAPSRVDPPPATQPATEDYSVNFFDN